ncbi:PREDICTED: NADPH oxidase 1 isoform X3 [Miniopterus natalensis]|uniref:NADPH oxidase 1 isoform X3 n=1 Tax=Miniopterus natalensis TaxID=291302 RepID=UPI0007A6BD6D|nr:PREDICTED: NADPH oxidase 1 isoform X3 [Miniopterus natalensis]
MHLFVLEVLWVDVHLPCLKDSQTLNWKEVPTLKNLSRVQAAESFLLLKKVPNHLLRMANWVVNHWLSVLVLVTWLGLNAFLFTHAFLSYEKGDKYYYTREILGSALAWARASARCLNFNSMLILLPMCRNLLSFLRGTCSFCRRTLRKQLDHNLTFHKLVAYMICLHTAIHIIAHLFNFERYRRSRQATDGSLASVLSSLSHQEKEGDSWLNPIQSPNTTVIYMTFTSIPGLTGVIITIVLVLMVTSSMEFIRRSYFEVFWYTHHIFIIYFIGLGIHGIGGIVRGQTEESLKESHPHRCAEFFEKWDDHDSHCKRPQFEGNSAESWKWILAPGVLYIFERILRFYRSQQQVMITKVVMHPSKVLELQMIKRGFSMEVGQYIFVNCPSISYLEWHPFTLTSAPEEDFFSIHIRAAGDWTENLIKAFEQQHSPIPRIEVDGPFGTVSEDVFQYEVAMLVGAGIGVTPFASILKSIWYKFRHEDHNLKTQKVGHAALNFDKATDILTGLKHKTFFGRPMWDNEFSTIATSHPKSVVGVFLCGPQALAKRLRKCCHQYSSLDPRKVQFYFNKENF